MRVCWTQWATLSARQHLLLSCYILVSQQTILLARIPESSPQMSIDELPFPVEQSLWDAEAANEWFKLVQQPLLAPRTVLEAYSHPTAGGYQDFSAVVLTATYYARLDHDAISDGAVGDHLFANSPETQHRILTAKLVRLVPVRALLAVSGESWVLGTKSPSSSEFKALRATLQAWLCQLFSCSFQDDISMTAEALRISIASLNLSFTTPRLLNTDVGHTLGLFIAGLVVWAATVATSTRAIRSGTSTQHPQLSLALQEGPSPMARPLAAPETNTQPSTFNPIDEVSGLYQNSHSTLVLPDPTGRRSSITHTEIEYNLSRFLASAIGDLASSQVTSCQTGCTSLLLWMKMRFRDVSLHEQIPSVPDMISPGDYHGELTSIILGQIERMLSQGWGTWGI